MNLLKRFQRNWLSGGNSTRQSAVGHSLIQSSGTHPHILGRYLGRPWHASFVLRWIRCHGRVARKHRLVLTLTASCGRSRLPNDSRIQPLPVSLTWPSTNSGIVATKPLPLSHDLFGRVRLRNLNLYAY